MDELRKRLEKHLVSAAKSKSLVDGSSLHVLVLSVFEDVEEKQSLAVLVEQLLKALVGVEVKTICHHLVQVNARVDVLVYDLYAIDVAVDVLKRSPMRLILKSLEV